MRIDGYLPAHDAQATDGTRRTAADADGVVRQGGPAGPAAPSSDRVEISGDTALVTAAVKAANEASGIRADRVEAAREKLHAGRVGADPIALAEAILNDILP